MSVLKRTQALYFYFMPFNNIFNGSYNAQKRLETFENGKNSRKTHQIAMDYHVPLGRFKGTKEWDLYGRRPGTKTLFSLKRYRHTHVIVYRTHLTLMLICVLVAQ